MPTAEDEEREQLAKEISKDWSSGNPPPLKKKGKKRKKKETIFVLNLVLLHYFRLCEIIARNF